MSVALNLFYPGNDTIKRKRPRHWRQGSKTKEQRAVTRTEKGEDGEPVMVLMPRITIVDADKISDEAAAAVAEVWQTVNGALRVKMHDKHAALVSLGKHLSCSPTA
jgi:hypothetical protein